MSASLNIVKFGQQNLDSQVTAETDLHLSYLKISYY